MLWSRMLDSSEIMLALIIVQKQPGLVEGVGGELELENLSSPSQPKPFHYSLIEKILLGLF